MTVSEATTKLDVVELAGESVELSTYRELNAASFSIKTLFQITTASALFFWCLRFSPVLAIGITVFVAPAIIRTGLISELYRRNELAFGYATRLKFFVGSIGIVILTSAFAASVFILTSLLFGFFGMAFSSMVGARELSTDAAVVGTAGGMIWGMAAALLAVGFAVVKTWIPRNLITEARDKASSRKPK